MDVCLEPLEEKHALVSYKWRNNPLLWQHTFNKPDKEITLEMELEWLKKVIQNKNEKRFAILADGIYVGNIYLTNIENRASFFGIFLGDEKAQGKGIAMQAMEKLFEKAKNEFEIDRVYLRVKKANESAQRLYKKLKFNKIEEKEDYFLMEKHL